MLTVFSFLLIATRMTLANGSTTIQWKFSLTQTVSKIQTILDDPNGVNFKYRIVGQRDNVLCRLAELGVKKSPFSEKLVEDDVVEQNEDIGSVEVPCFAILAIPASSDFEFGHIFMYDRTKYSKTLVTKSIGSNPSCTYSWKDVSSNFSGVDVKILQSRLRSDEALYKNGHVWQPRPMETSDVTAELPLQAFQVKSTDGSELDFPEYLYKEARKVLITRVLNEYEEAGKFEEAGELTKKEKRAMVWHHLFVEEDRDKFVANLLQNEFIMAFLDFVDEEKESLGEDKATVRALVSDEMKRALEEYHSNFWFEYQSRGQSEAVAIQAFKVYPNNIELQQSFLKRPSGYISELFPKAVEVFPKVNIVRTWKNGTSVGTPSGVRDTAISERNGVGDMAANVAGRDGVGDSSAADSETNGTGVH